MNHDEKKETRDVKAAAAVNSFYVNLEGLLKRHQPFDYAPFAARQLAAAFENPPKLAQVRPHHTLHSIEANCAFSRGQNRDPVDHNRFHRVMNVYYNHEDPFHAGLIEDEKITLLFQAMYREQFEIQYRYSQDELARNQELFVDGHPMPNLEREFQSKYGLSFDVWIKLCFFATAAAQSHGSQMFHRNILAECRFHTIPSDQVDAFLRLSSSTPRQIGDRFQNLRKNTKPQFHSLIRSAFLGTPMICFPDGLYFSPHPPLILRHGGQGLYNAIKSLDSFGEEFGATVQRYVGKLVNCATKIIHMFGNTDLESFSSGKSCDYLIEFPEYVLLIESKATSFVSERITENAILNDGSTAKIANGIEQLYTTAYDLKSGVFESLQIDREKPVIGIVTTFGDIPFVNSDWYRESFITKRAQSKFGCSNLSEYEHA